MNDVSMPQTQRTRSHAWSYPDDHLFYRTPGKHGRRILHQTFGSTTLFDQAYPHFFTSSSIRRNDEQNFRASRRKATATDGVASPSTPSDIPRLLCSWLTRGLSSGVSVGQLEKLKEMPYDVLYEIFGYLHPVDLLRLSRTSRSLRSVLLSKSSVTVWRASLGSVYALPTTCPSGLNEVQYASLAFDNWCHFCLEPGVDTISWVARVRCCNRCINQHFISQDELELWIPKEVWIGRLDSLFPYASCRPVAPPIFLLSAAKDFIEELEGVVATKDEEAIAKWVKAKRELQSEKVAHAAVCEYWARHLAYRPLPRPARYYASEISIVLLLALLLLCLWQRQMAQPFLKAATVLSRLLGEESQVIMAAL